MEPITCAVVGSLMGFLLFNVYPAKVFMGDTGSLALGGFVAGVAYAMQMPLFPAPKTRTFFPFKSIFLFLLIMPGERSGT